MCTGGAGRESCARSMCVRLRAAAAAVRANGSASNMAAAAARARHRANSARPEPGRSTATATTRYSLQFSQSRCTFFSPPFSLIYLISHILFFPYFISVIIFILFFHNVSIRRIESLYIIIVYNLFFNFNLACILFYFSYFVLVYFCAIRFVNFAVRFISCFIFFHFTFNVHTSREQFI